MRPSDSLPMAQAARPLLSFDEYLQIEGDGLVRHEYLDGVVWAMGAGTDEHAALAANVIRLLGNQLLGRPCRVNTMNPEPGGLLPWRSPTRWRAFLLSIGERRATREYRVLLRQVLSRRADGARSTQG